MREGTTTITVASAQNPNATATCTVRVLSEEEAGNTLAYAITADRRLISFNPNVPSEYTVIHTIPQASNVVGMDVHGRDVYYATSSGGNPTLYLYNMDSRISTYVGTLQTYTNSYNDLVYDPANNMVYLACGLYVYQYYVPNVRAGNSLPSSHVMPTVAGMPSQGSVYGVTIVDGQVVALCVSQGDTFLYQIDSFSGSGTCTFLGWVEGLSITQGSTEFTYDAAMEAYYVTNARSELYTFTEENIRPFSYDEVATREPAKMIGSVGGGTLDITGLAIANTATQSAAALTGAKATQAIGLARYTAAPIRAKGLRSLSV